MTLVFSPMSLVFPEGVGDEGGPEGQLSCSAKGKKRLLWCPNPMGSLYSSLG